MKVHTERLTRNRRPHLYRKGTRVHVVAIDADISAIDRRRGAPTAGALDKQVGSAVAAAVNGWMGEFGPKPTAEEMCLFISFTTFQIVVEVSDANAHEFDHDQTVVEVRASSERR